MDGIVTIGVSDIVGDCIFTGLCSIYRTHGGSFQTGIDVIRYSGSSILISISSFNGHFCIASDRNYWTSRVDDSHLAGDFGSLIASVVSKVVGQSIFTELRNIDWIDHRNLIGDVTVEVIGSGDASIDVLRATLMSHFSFTLKSDHWRCGIDNCDLAGDFSFVSSWVENLVSDRVLPGGRDI